MGTSYVQWTEQNPLFRFPPHCFLAWEAVLDPMASDESGAFSSDTKTAIDEYQMWTMGPANMSVCLLQVMHVPRKNKVSRRNVDSYINHGIRICVWGCIMSDIVAHRREQGHADT